MLGLPSGFLSLVIFTLQSVSPRQAYVMRTLAKMKEGRNATSVAGNGSSNSTEQSCESTFEMQHDTLSDSVMVAWRLRVLVGEGVGRGEQAPPCRTYGRGRPS